MYDNIPYHTTSPNKFSISSNIISARSARAGTSSPGETDYVIPKEKDYPSGLGHDNTLQIGETDSYVVADKPHKKVGNIVMSTELSF